MRRIDKFRVIGLVVAFLFSMPAISLAQTGKVAGTVTDAETGEPLPGASVVIDGTTLGASVDVDGNYFIINVPPGEYDVTARFVGFGNITMTGVNVDVGRTSEVDFALSSEVIQQGDITITAERPAVRVDATSTEQFIESETIEAAPVQNIGEVLELQAGIDEGRFRGGFEDEVVYQLDGMSLNNGMFSSNYTGVNLTAIEEISVLTGGYNAEHGGAQSAIVNVVTKAASNQFGGTVVGRLRPPGKYHFGRNFYSQDNYDYQNFDLDYWTEQASTEDSPYFGEDPQQLLQRWRDQLVPSDTLGRYTDRPEYEVEATLYGPLILDGLSFMVSGRFLRDVNIWPQTIPSNPEHNFQGKLVYDVTQNLELTLSGLYGDRKQATDLMAPWGPGFTDVITDPYDYGKFADPGDHFGPYPVEEKTRGLGLEARHMLSRSTFYSLRASYFSSKSDAEDPLDYGSEDFWSLSDDIYGMLNHYVLDGHYFGPAWTDYQALRFEGDITSQVTPHHQFKAGIGFNDYSMNQLVGLWWIEGSTRWNTNSTWFDNADPYEGHVYVQDKIEYEGLVVNAGLRFSFFGQGRAAPVSMWDPLALSPTTPGNTDGLGIPGDPDQILQVDSEIQTAVAPRIGLSHPITESSVLHFYYGHFYQRPSWELMLQLPFGSNAETYECAVDPWCKTQSYYQSNIGNPFLSFQKTVQYEVGFDQNIARKALLSLTAYYKDYSRQATTASDLEPAGGAFFPGWMNFNGGYKDNRGLEVKVESRLEFPVNVMMVYDISYNSGGDIGNVIEWEDPNRTDQPFGYEQFQEPWSRQNRFKGLLDVRLPENFGPEVAGLSPIGGINASAYFEWREGSPYTYHGPGDVSTEPNNRKWFDHYRTNIRASKRISLIAGQALSLGVEVRNLFNNKDLIRPEGEGLIKYHDNPDGTLAERMPTHFWSGEPNVWGWYDHGSNPPRQVYFQVRYDF